MYAVVQLRGSQAEPATCRAFLGEMRLEQSAPTGPRKALGAGHSHSLPKHGTAGAKPAIPKEEARTAPTVLRKALGVDRALLPSAWHNLLAMSEAILLFKSLHARICLVPACLIFHM